jgi:glycosyltransferase involved in cell wall biosynthesis
MLAGRCFGRRVILDHPSGEAADPLARWSWFVHPLRLPHEIVVPLRHLATVFDAHGYRARVIANTVDVWAFRPVERPSHRRRLLSVRNLEAINRMDVLLDAFARVRMRHPDATLTVSGVGRLEAALRVRAAAIGRKGIRFVGRVESADMPRLYAEADLLVNASVVDNQPLTLLEALAAGLVVPAADPARFGAALEGLLDDSPRAMRLAAQGPQSLEPITWAAQRRQWFEAYLGAQRLDASPATAAES